MMRRDDFVFFWGPKARYTGFLSQWYPSQFTAQVMHWLPKKGIAKQSPEQLQFHNAEQFMMASKAALFGDEKHFAEIMATDCPSYAKTLGRYVQGFSETIWGLFCDEIVTAGNLAKFSQCERLGRMLLETEDRMLVEASPYDYIWGVGLAEKDERILDPEKWRGTNKLGNCLMAVRDELTKERKKRREGLDKMMEISEKYGFPE